MDIPFPADLQWVSYLAGSHWPQGSETAWERTAGYLRAAAAQLETDIGDLNPVRAHISAVMLGETQQAFEKQFAQVFTGKAALDNAVAALRSLGDAAETLSTEIQYTKLQIITTLMIAAATIIWAVVNSEWTAGGSLAEIPIVQWLTENAISRTVAMALERISATLAEKLGSTLVARLVVEGAVSAALGASQEAGIEAIQVAEGRRGFDAATILRSAASMGAAGVAGGLAGHVVGGLLGHEGSTAMRVLKGAVTGLASGEAANVAGAVVGKLDGGGGNLSLDTVLGGAIGLVHGGLHGAGGVGDAGVGAGASVSDPENPAAPANAIDTHPTLRLEKQPDGTFAWPGETATDSGPQAHTASPTPTTESPVGAGELAPARRRMSWPVAADPGARSVEATTTTPAAAADAGHLPATRVTAGFDAAPTAHASVGSQLPEGTLDPSITSPAASAGPISATASPAVSPAPLESNAVSPAAPTVPTAAGAPSPAPTVPGAAGLPSPAPTATPSAPGPTAGLSSPTPDLHAGAAELSPAGKPSSEPAGGPAAGRQDSTAADQQQRPGEPVTQRQDPSSRPGVNRRDSGTGPRGRPGKLRSGVARDTGDLQPAAAARAPDPLAAAEQTGVVRARHDDSGREPRGEGRGAPAVDSRGLRARDGQGCGSGEEDTPDRSPGTAGGDGDGAGGGSGLASSALPPDPRQPRSAEERDFLDWYEARGALPEGQRQSLPQYAAMTGIDAVQSRRWLAGVGVDPAVVDADEAPGRVPEPAESITGNDWLAALRRYLALSPHQMDRLIEAEPGRWARIESGAAEATTAQVRALLRRVPEARVAYHGVADRFPAYGLLTDTGEARWPEGYEHLHHYLKAVRVQAGVSRRGLAEAAGKSIRTVEANERGRYTPPRDWIDEYLRLGGGVTYADLAECCGLAVEQLRFPSLSAVAGLGEYVAYLQRVNNLAGVDVVQLLGLSARRSMHEFLGVAHHDESMVLRIWRLVLHRAGPYNDLARAWGYRYRMDPQAGDVFPRPHLFDHPRNWAFSLRLYHALTREQLASRTGLTADQIKFAETEHGYSPPHLHTIHDAGLIPEDARHAALNQLLHLLTPANYTADAVGFGRWLAAQRDNTGMTQKQLAAAADVSVSHLSNTENGAKVSRAAAHRLCVAAGVAEAMWQQARAHFFPPVDTTLANYTADAVGFGRWLAALRDNAGMTQEQLALASGRSAVSQGNISAIENGGRVTSPVVAHSLCVAAGVSDLMWQQARAHFFPPVDTTLANYTADAVGFGRWLAAQRNNAGMSQQQLATPAGLHWVHVNRIENGRWEPPRTTARTLCVAVGVSDALWEQARAHFFPPVDTTPGNHTLGSWLKAHLDNADLTQTQLATAAHLSQGYTFEITRDAFTPPLRTFRRLCDALDIHGPPRVEAIRRFYSDRYRIDADPNDERDLWLLVDTPPDSPQERELRNQIYERYDGIARIEARRWVRILANRYGLTVDYQDLYQDARAAILTAIVNHTPTSPLIVHAFASCRGAMRQAADALLQERQHQVSLDKPLTSSRSGDEIQRDVADPTATTAFADSDFIATVRAALADLPDPDTATRLVILHLVDDIPLDQEPEPGSEIPPGAAQQLGLSPQTAAEIISAAIPRLHTAFQPSTPGHA